MILTKSLVVSGDEKQLPPTTFFGGKSGGAADDANDDGAANDALSDGDLDNAEEDRLENVEGHAMLRRKIDLYFFAQPLRPGNGNGMTFNSLATERYDCPSGAITGWDFFRALLGCACDSRRVGPHL